MTHPRHCRRLLGLLAVIVLAVPACRVTDLMLWHPGAPRPDSFEVEEVLNVSYWSSPDATDRHQLDLYLPEGARDYPVVVLVHGATWIMGYHPCCGLYSSLRRFL